MPIPGGPRPTHIPARPLREVAEAAGAELPPGLDEAAVDRSGFSDVLVSGVTLSSRTVRPGDLYAALPGRRVHGGDFAAAAASAGAVAVLTDPDGARRAAGCGLPIMTSPAPRERLGPLAAWLYGRPAERLLTLAVTGTNGKTTTTYLLDSALRRAGRRTGLVGTVALRVADELIPATGTTPEAPDLQALLAVMVEHGVEVCSMEISSHALDQRRVDGLTVDVAGFTNLSQDHLDYHHTMQDYFEAKAHLFTEQHAHRAVICVDDDWGPALARRCEVPFATVAVRTPSGTNALTAPHWQVLSTTRSTGVLVARVRTPNGTELDLPVPLPGEFNVANTLLALAMLVEAGTGLDEAVQALAGAEPVPGRMQRIPATGRAGEPLAVVDYAHTPAAVAAALTALREHAEPLVVVIGAGGDRDRQKRPMMGRAAAEWADVVVVTDDNPRSEDPGEIRAALLRGARQAAPSSGAEIVEVPDRGSAIAEAVRRAWTASGTGVVLVAGKGHEQGQETLVAGVVTVQPFDDRSVLAEALAGVGQVARTST